MKASAWVVRAVLTAAAIGVFYLPRPAWAFPPIDHEAAIVVGAGSHPAFEGPNPLGFGVGARAGLSVVGLYGGVTFLYCLGGSAAIPAPPGTLGLPGATVSVSEHALLYGVQLGYDVRLFEPLRLRPQLGVGDFMLFASSGSASSSSTQIYVEPGGSALVSFGQAFIGLDANVLVLPNVPDPISGAQRTDVAFTLHAEIGIQL